MRIIYLYYERECCFVSVYSFAAALTVPRFCNYIRMSRGIPVLRPGDGPRVCKSQLMREYGIFKAFLAEHFDCVHEHKDTLTKPDGDAKNAGKQKQWNEKFAMKRLLDVDGNTKLLLALEAEVDKLENSAEVAAARKVAQDYETITTKKATATPFVFIQVYLEPVCIVLRRDRESQ